MKYRFAWLVGLLFIAGALLPSPANAQGSMSDTWTDLNGDLYTEVFSTEVAYCPTSYVWSDLVGADGTQYSGSDVIQWVTSATPGTDYTWYFGGTVYAPDPYGSCQAYGWNVSISIKYTVTEYVNPVQSGSTCNYSQLYCTHGTPTCTGPISTEILSGPPQCLNFADAFFVSTSNSQCVHYVAAGVYSATGLCD